MTPTVSNTNATAVSRLGEAREKITAQLSRIIVGQEDDLRWEEQGGKRLLNTLVLDARDGREIFQHTGEALRRKVLHLRGDRETYQIDLRVAVKDGAWTLRLTDTPRPPSPPYGHETATKRKNMGALIFDAVCVIQFVLDSPV